MTPKQIRYIVENIHMYIEKNQDYFDRLEGFANTDSLQYEILLQQADENEEILNTFIEGMKFLESDPKYERHVMMVKLRANGWTYKRIGTIWGLTRERVRQVLNQAYELISDNT